MNLKSFFKPNWKTILIFFVLLLIAFLGSMQSWSFSGKDSGVSKPFLYDTVQFIPFWSLWMILISPLFVVLEIFKGLLNAQLNIDFPRGLFWTINLFYFYFLSQAIIFFIDYIQRKKQSRSLNQIKGV